MFTGIIEEIGKIVNIRKGQKSSLLTVEASKVLDGTKVGDSIATNGVCLTVTQILSENTFMADVMAETLRRSNLGDLKVGELVNLERALCLNSRLGGHLVSGHIDDIGEIIDYKREDNAIWVTIKAGNDVLRYVVTKGSIAIDGISLTVAYVDEHCFKVSVIPHTGEETTLLKKRVKDTVNLECDVIGKYVDKLINNNATVNKNISEEFLKLNGFY